MGEIKDHAGHVRTARRPRFVSASVANAAVILSAASPTACAALPARMNRSASLSSATLSSAILTNIIRSMQQVGALPQGLCGIVVRAFAALQLVRTVYERERFVFRKIVGVRTVAACGHQYTSIRTFVDDRAVQVADCRDIDGTCVTLCLEHIFTAA